MPTPPLSAEEIDRRRVGIEQALRDGYAPMGIYGGKGSAVQEAARYQPPIQALWFTHPRRGVTAHWPVYLEGNDPASADVPWSSWAAKAA